jgi:hypothetical protein
MLVSVSGKRDFTGQRQRRRKGPSHSIDRQQRQSARTKTRQFGAICATPENLCLYGIAWWRTQSQSNLSQQQNSLLTGKITGNFADSGLNPQFWWRVSQRIQPLKAKFPAKRNREFFQRIRELISKNRELQLPKSKVVG